MSPLGSGQWQPWEPDRSGRHQCGAGSTHSKLLPPSATTPETYLTRCPWCRQHVYYHTNGRGDTVYFQQLGYPWQIHPCWEDYWSHAKNGDRLRKRILGDRHKPKVQLLILQGAIRKIPNIAQISIGVYRVSETELAQQMGLSLKKLRENYGHLYVVFSPFELRIISDRHQPKSEQKAATEHKVNVVIKNSRSSFLSEKQLALPRVKCPLCGRMVYQCRLGRHVQLKHGHRKILPFQRR